MGPMTSLLTYETGRVNTEPCSHPDSTNPQSIRRTEGELGYSSSQS